MKLLIYTDGGSRGNPGKGAVGVVIKQFDNNKALSPDIKFGKRIGRVTNNEAEYKAIIEALTYVKEHFTKLDAIEFRLDSLLVCQQIRGIFKVKLAHLQALLWQVKQLEMEINTIISYSHIPRTQNAEADRLVNSALDEV